ncbi:hypothetical protein Ndes2526B_g04092 [Nannochloris sp. 'desiccata']|nr:hypothetical protein NADE_002812 [Chlorella desiccata (nom. nud.)]
MEYAPIETVEVAGPDDYFPKYSDQAPEEALGAQVAPVEDAENNNWDTFDVPRRKRSGLPKRRPGTAWHESSQLSGPLPTYSGYASPTGTAPFGQAASLRPDDEEEIAAALFDLAQTSREAKPGLMAGENNDSLILPSSRKRPRKPSRVGVQYESNYEAAFEHDWDAEDEYLAKRNGTGRFLSNSRGYPPMGKGHNTSGGGGHQHINGDPQQSDSISNGPRFKPGPNHAAISHFIQWHRRHIKAPQQQQQESHPAGASPAAALAASAIARAQGMSQNHAGAGARPPSGLDISALAALLPTLQAGLRQGAGGGGVPAGNQLAGFLGQLVAGQGRGQMTPETMEILHQLVRRQSAQRQQEHQQPPPTAVAPQPSSNVPANFAAVLARLKNAQAKAQGVAMAAAATQGRPAPLQNGQQQQHQQQQHATNQPSAAVLQNLKALLTANAQRAQQRGNVPGQPGQLPPSHVDLMQLMKQSLDIAKANPNIKAWVAKQQQRQGTNNTTAPVLLPVVDIHSGVNAPVVPITIAATPAEAIPTIIAAADIAEPAQVKVENNEAATAGGEGVTNRVAEQGFSDANPALEDINDTNPATVAETSDQIKENVAVPSIPSFESSAIGALDAMRAYLVQQKQNVAAATEREGISVDAGEMKNVGNGYNDNTAVAAGETAT